MTKNSINTENVNEMFEIAKESMKRSLDSVKSEPYRDFYTRFDRPVSRVTVNGEDTIIVW